VNGVFSRRANPARFACPLFTKPYKVGNKKSVIKHEHLNGAAPEAAEVKTRLLEYLTPYLMGKGIAFHVPDTYSLFGNFS
jgi:hypothetical protein